MANNRVNIWDRLLTQSYKSIDHLSKINLSSEVSITEKQLRDVRKDIIGLQGWAVEYMQATPEERSFEYKEGGAVESARKVMETALPLLTKFSDEMTKKVIELIEIISKMPAKEDIKNALDGAEFSPLSVAGRESSGLGLSPLSFVLAPPARNHIPKTFLASNGMEKLVKAVNSQPLQTKNDDRYLSYITYASNIASLMNEDLLKKTAAHLDRIEEFHGDKNGSIATLKKFLGKPEVHRKFREIQACTGALISTMLPILTVLQLAENSQVRTYMSGSTKKSFRFLEKAHENFANTFNKITPNFLDIYSKLAEYGFVKMKQSVSMLSSAFKTVAGSPTAMKYAIKFAGLKGFSISDTMQTSIRGKSPFTSNFNGKTFDDYKQEESKRAKQFDYKDFESRLPLEVLFHCMENIVKPRHNAFNILTECPQELSSPQHYKEVFISVANKASNTVVNESDFHRDASIFFNACSPSALDPKEIEEHKQCVTNLIKMRNDMANLGRDERDIEARVAKRTAIIEQAINCVVPEPRLRKFMDNCFDKSDQDFSKTDTNANNAKSDPSVSTANGDKDLALARDNFIKFPTKHKHVTGEGRNLKIKSEQQDSKGSAVLDGLKAIPGAIKRVVYAVVVKFLEFVNFIKNICVAHPNKISEEAKQYNKKVISSDTPKKSRNAESSKGDSSATGHDSPNTALQTSQISCGTEQKQTASRG